ncbi:HNH endonuclease [Sutcliffiella horikoshii]|uniref:HNH endonuclease n=1 Tax=Sutcliffiella horikoshii TaxID=79883 RepID=UPI00384CFF1F
MRNLVPPCVDEKLVYNNIEKNARNEDKKKRLTDLKQSIFLRYEHYNENVYNLEKLENSIILDDKDKKALHSCYNRNKHGYLEGKVVSQILQIQSPQHKNKCPYCGMDKPRTIDHYIPKEDFPEFSVFPPNLIPCCGYCNTKKNDRWLKDGERIFLNLYYDELPKDKKFLYSNIVLDEDEMNPVPIITFELKNNTQIPTELFSLIENHYSNLDLLNEFSLIVESEVSEVFDKIIHNTSMPILEHQNTIKRDLDTLVRKYGINHWNASFLESLLNCKEFFDRAYKHANKFKDNKKFM